MPQPPDFNLCQGDLVLGDLHYYGYDFPWFLCRFVPAAAFTRVAPVFERRPRHFEADPDDGAAADPDWDRTAALELSIVSLRTGEVHHSIDINFDGEGAEFKIYPGRRDS